MIISLLLVGAVVGSAGQQPCEAGRYGEHAPTPITVPEVCYAWDDDCDAGHSDLVEEASAKVDLIFLVDVSGSMEPYLGQLQSAINRYVSEYPAPEYRFGLITFPGQREEDPHNSVIFLNSASSFLGTFAVIGLSVGGGDEAGALKIMAERDDGLLWRRDARSVILLITDAELGNHEVPPFHAPNPEIYRIFIDRTAPDLTDGIIRFKIHSILRPPTEINTYLRDRVRGLEMENAILRSQMTLVTDTYRRFRDETTGVMAFLALFLIVAGLATFSIPLRKQRLELKIAEANERAALYQGLNDELSGKTLAAEIEALQPATEPPDEIS